MFRGRQGCWQRVVWVVSFPISASEAGLFLSRAERRGVSIGSQISVLTSSTFNTVNLFTNSDWGALFISYTKQNPPPGWSPLPLPLLHPSKPLNLRSILSVAPQLASGRPSSRGSPLRGGWPLRTDSTLVEVGSASSGLRLHL